jgi:hypothetical protein
MRKRERKEENGKEREREREKIVKFDKMNCYHFSLSNPFEPMTVFFFLSLG